MQIVRKTLKALLPYAVVQYIEQNKPATQSTKAQPAKQNTLHDKIKKYSSDLQTADYQIPMLEQMLSIANITSLDGSQICEVGGDGKFGIARLLYRLSGKKVVVSSPQPYTDLSDAELENLGVSLRRVPFESMACPENLFDIIYGCAVLEHINDVENFFKTAYDRLKPGGWLLVHGCPTWYSAVGHHTYKDFGDVLYSFGNEKCPVKPYSHLFMTKSEQYAALLEQKIPEEHAKIICEEMYDSDHVNRLSITEICQPCISLVWKEVKIFTQVDRPPHEYKEQLSLVGLSEKDVQRSFIIVAAKKPEC